MLHTSLLSAKAPIVAIPVPGKRPQCFDRAKLAAWCRKVTVTHATLNPEGLKLAGHSGSVRTTCTVKPLTLPICEVRKKLYAWAATQRERTSGRLSVEQRKALKRVALGDTSALTVQVWNPQTGRKHPYPGVPIELPEMAGLEFAMVCIDGIQCVVELATGKTAGNGRSPQSALAAARAKVCGATPAQLTAIYMEVANAL